MKAALAAGLVALGCILGGCDSKPSPSREMIDTVKPETATPEEPPAASTAPAPITKDQINGLMVGDSVRIPTGEVGVVQDLGTIVPFGSDGKRIARAVVLLIDGQQRRLVLIEEATVVQIMPTR